MSSRVTRFKQSPVAVRTLPFLIFLFLTFAQGWFGDAARFWIYLLKTALGAWMIWLVRRSIAEMRWKLSWEAVAVGVAVFVMWVGLVPFLQMLGINASWAVVKTSTPPWNPTAFFQNAIVAWTFIVVRIVGSTLVVPPLEEVFFRSFVYRYVAKPDFQLVPIGQFFWTPFIVTSVLFGFEHIQWLAGILCGFAYQGLVCWKKRLGDAITAHAITNFLLGIWVVHKGAWHFW